MPTPRAGARVRYWQYQTQRDERVCSICAPLDGYVWSELTPKAARPVVPQHFHCRCRIIYLGRWAPTHSPALRLRGGRLGPQPR